MVMRLSETNLIEALEQPEYAELRSSFSRRMLARGETAFSPDVPDDKVLVVVEGRIRIFLAYEDKEFTLNYLEKGDIFSTHTRTWGTAEEDAVLLVTDVSVFRDHLLSFPELTGAMIRVLGNLLRNSFSVIGSLAFKDIHSRLCDFFMEKVAQSSDDSKNSNTDVVVHFELTIEELARIVGASRQTVSTLLNDMERSGMIRKQSRGVYIVPDPSRLAKHTLC